MKILITLSLSLFGLGELGIQPNSQQNSATTEIDGAGPRTNFPARYHKMEERLAQRPAGR